MLKDGKLNAWRPAAGLAVSAGRDPQVKESEGVTFYGKTGGRAWVFALPCEPTAGA